MLPPPKAESGSGCLLGTLLGRCFSHIQQGAGLGPDPGHAGGGISSGWPVNALEVLLEELEEAAVWSLPAEVTASGTQTR